MTNITGFEIIPGLLGIASAMIFSNLGAAIGMAKSGISIGGIG